MNAMVPASVLALPQFGADDAAPGGQADAAGDDAIAGTDQVNTAAPPADEPAAAPAPVVAAAGLTAADLTLDLF